MYLDICMSSYEPTQNTVFPNKMVIYEVELIAKVIAMHSWFVFSFSLSHRHLLILSNWFIYSSICYHFSIHYLHTFILSVDFFSPHVPALHILRLAKITMATANLLSSDALQRKIRCHSNLSEKKRRTKTAPVQTNA